MCNDKTKCVKPEDHKHHDHHDHHHHGPHGPHGQHGPHDLAKANPDTLFGIMRLAGHALRFAPDMDTAFNGLTAEEQTQLKQLLTKLYNSLKSEEEAEKDKKDDAKSSDVQPAEAE